MWETICEVKYMNNERQPKPSPNTKSKKPKIDRPIPPDIYPIIDTDLARDNIENDMTYADLWEL